MSAIISTVSQPIELPPPRVPIAIRDATLADLPFIDSLQKMHTKQVGFMPEGQLRGKIEAGDVVLAEQSGGERVGYCIGTDRYFKHDDVGIIYQLNVEPRKQRGFIGAALLKAMFERAAYGCKLYCCWCAQDIEANRFWEAMGFVPLAFRAGSEKKSRVHIFWQKRIRAGDTQTPWWFPAKTGAGALREDRLVLPIPAGTHWSDEMPRILPTAGVPTAGVPTAGVPAAMEDQRAAVKGARGKRQPSTLGPVKHGPRQYGPPPTSTAIAQAVAEQAKPKPEKKPKRKADPKLVAAARELRDRWLEQMNATSRNAGEHLIERSGKYAVARLVSGRRASEPGPQRLIAA